MEYFEIRKITRQGERLVVNIPKKSYFKVGEYVLIKKINPKMEAQDVK